MSALMSAQSLQLAPRPGFCTDGTLLEVFVNAFEVRSFPKEPFTHYDEISPVISPRGAQKVMQRLQTHTAPRMFSRTAVAFDGAKNLYAIRSALFPEGSMTFNVNMRDEPPTGPDARGLYNVTIKKVADIMPSDLMRVLQGHEAGLPITSTPLQVLNVLIQQSAALRFPLHTKQKFYESGDSKIIGGLEILRGYFVSVRPTLEKLYVNVDMATGVMYQRGELIDFVLGYFNIRDARDLNRFDEGHKEWHRVTSVLRKLQVLCGPNGRLRTIDSIAANAGDIMFPLSDGQSTTVAEYYRDRYRVVLRYPHFPGIRPMKRSRDVIPFELCKVKEGQLFKKKLTGAEMSQILNFAKKRPNERFDILRKGIELMQLGDSPYVKQAGLNISSQPMEIHGRVLDPPSMTYGNNVTQRPSSGSWNMVGRQLVEPMSISTWGVLSFTDGLPDRDLQQFTMNLARAMEAVGMKFKLMEPRIMKASQYRARDELKSFCAECVKVTKAPPTMLLIILPESAASLRKTVKQFGDIEFGVVTQCVRVDRMMRANNQYHNNLILKINAKLGGRNTTPSRDYAPFGWFEDGKTMVIGADVTHAAPGVLRPSVAALVASVDEGAAQYVCRCEVQGPRVEIIERLENLMEYVLNMFYRYRKHVGKTKSNNVPLLPERIVFYRDGVSEGEIHKVVEEEIKQIKAASETVYAGLGCPYRPRLTFIVVGKRHHIRFFPKQGRGADKSGNAPAGLLVDKEITSPGIFDFYLQSHAGLLGTSRPSHYIVIKDENMFDANRLAGFSYALCHTYARATRSVSIPAPCYYADIACARADHHFHPSLNYEDDLSSSGGEFDLERWQKGFANVHSEQCTKMYFM